MSGITYTGAQIPTDFKEQIISEILFRNETVEKGLVAFETGIKAGRVITENINSEPCRLGVLTQQVRKLAILV